MNPLPFYFQGSLIGCILGFALILALGFWAGATKVETIRNIKTSYKAYALLGALVLWGASFVNVGHTQNSLQRHKFDNVNITTAKPDQEVIQVERIDRDSVKLKAEETRTRIQEESK